METVGKFKKFYKKYMSKCKAVLDCKKIKELRVKTKTKKISKK